jgi:methyl-accepting chemotaxis protein
MFAMATQAPPKKKSTASRKKSVKKKVAPATAKTAKKKTAPAAAARASKKTAPSTAGNTKSSTESRVLPGLMKSLQSVFDKIHSDNQVRDDNQEKFIEEFGHRLSRAFEQAHDEAKQREKLLQEKLQAIEREQSYKIQRIKLFSLPGTLIAVAALIYLFYVVHVMERSMNSMSADMHQIQNHIATIGGDTGQMSSGVVEMNQQMAQINTNIQQIDRRMGDMNGNMTQMNGNMHHLNRNVGVMTNDVGAMSHTVSPVMNTFNKFMPMF